MERTKPYDMWSVGVVWLELVLATPHVFSIPERMQSLMRHVLNLSQVITPSPSNELISALEHA